MMFSKALSFFLLLGATRVAKGDDYSYDPNAPNGPANWGNPNDPKNQCNGPKQSPIAFTTNGAISMDGDYVFTTGSCKAGDMTFETLNNGVIARFPGTCKANTMKMPTVDGTYKALQYHVHILSEHTFDGDDDFAFELHVVHQLESGKGESENQDVPGTNEFAVFGFAIKVGPSNADFGTLIAGWRQAHDADFGQCNQATRSLQANVRKLSGTFDIYSLVEDKTFFHYGGGLTNPPCSEAVWFNIAKNPVYISSAQATELKNIILDYRNDSCELKTLADPARGRSTSRPVQPLNGRNVLLIADKPADKPYGGEMGDPHVQLWNHKWIDFHGECDTVLLDAKSFEHGLGLAVHTRSTLRYDYSYVSSAAIRIGDDVLEVGSFGNYMLNGVSNADLPVFLADKFPVQHTQTKDTVSSFDIDLGQGDSITVTVFKDIVNIKIAGSRFEGSVGLMGSYGTGVMMARNGTTVVEDPVMYGQEWQTRPDEDGPPLFQVKRSPQYPEKCNMPSAKNTAVTRRLGEGISRVEAEKACGWWGPGNMERCVEDVIALSDLDFAKMGP